MRVGPEKRGNMYIMKTDRDVEPGVTVPAIASFDDKGSIAPLYFRVNGVTLRVMKYTVLDKHIRNMVTYECMVADGNFMKPLIIRYVYDTGVWVIPDRQGVNMFITE